MAEGSFDRQKVATVSDPENADGLFADPEEGAAFLDLPQTHRPGINSQGMKFTLFLIFLVSHIRKS